MHNIPKFSVTFFLIDFTILMGSCGQNKSIGITKAGFAAMVSDYFAWPHPASMDRINE